MFNNLTSLLDYPEVGAILFLVVLFLAYLNHVAVRHEKRDDQYATSISQLSTTTHTALIEVATALGAINQKLIDQEKREEEIRRVEQMGRLEKKVDDILSGSQS